MGPADLLLVIAIVAPLFALPVVSAIQSYRFARDHGWPVGARVAVVFAGWALWWAVLPVYTVWAVRYDWRQWRERRTTRSGGAATLRA